MRTTALILALCLALAPACNGAKNDAATPDADYPAEPDVEIEVINEGDGPQLVEGQYALVHYIGTFKDGRKFDSSRDAGNPFPVRVGRGQVIDGWNRVIPKMRVGDRWKVTIPYTLAYGERGSPPVIPPRTDLVFDMEIMGVAK